MMGMPEQRLLQALEQYARMSRGADTPKGALEGIQALQKSLSSPAASQDTPGSRAALQAAPGTTPAAASYRDAVKGPDRPSPGQQAATAAIDQAAAALAAAK